MGYEEFIGKENLKAEQLKQLELFRLWASNSNWTAFHDNHYDWWSFPIDKPSQKGFRYSISKEMREELKQDQGFINQLRESTVLLLLSWGWDAETSRPVANAEPGQDWANWPVRLFKCNRSLKMFAQADLVESSQKLAVNLRERGTSFKCRDKDLLPEILSSQL
jgi:hypothetical protein